jgi:flagellar hook-basal body complex protein FliE
MKEIDTSNLLAQLRINQAKFKQEITQPTTDINTKNSPSFSTLLQQSVDKVNELQQQSGELGKAFELNNPNVSLAEVMIAKQKAGIAFQSVLQVRNKLLSAYKDIMSMPV